MVGQTRGIDFPTLSLQDALDLAILVEEEAEERYQELKHQMEIHRTEEACAFFAFMATNEKKHGQVLAERRRSLFADAPRRVTRAMLFDVEAPDYDEARAFMAPKEALEVALRSEQKAFAFFQSALPHVTDPEVRALFEELAAEEVHHQELVGRELAKLPEGESIPTDAFVDDPIQL